MTFRYPDTIEGNPLIKDLKTIKVAVIGNNCTGISEIAKTVGPEGLRRYGERVGPRHFGTRVHAAYRQSDTRRLVAKTLAPGERNWTPFYARR